MDRGGFVATPVVFVMTEGTDDDADLSYGARGALA
jgi:hypothetical protein